MTTPLKTLFLNPPSFEKFDGGASSRWPATREIESYWYPVWLTYPAGMLEGSRLLDGPPHHIKWAEVVTILKDYEFLVLFTSTMGWDGDQKMAEVIKQTYPSIKIAFVGPPVTTSPEKALNECSAIDFICRREFDFSVVEFANGKPLNEILGVSYKDANGVIDPAQSRPGAGNAGTARRDAVGDGDLRSRPGRDQVQRAVPAAPVCGAVFDAWMPGAMQVLPVAADAERTRMAQAVDRRRGGGDGERQEAVPDM